MMLKVFFYKIEKLSTLTVWTCPVYLCYGMYHTHNLNLLRMNTYQYQEIKKQSINQWTVKGDVDLPKVFGNFVKS